MRKILILLFLILIAGLLVFRSDETKSTNKTYETQVNSQGDVGVAVTPLSLSKDSTKFKVVLTTHSVDLDYDLKEASVLVTAEKEYKALSWSGGRGGHHLEGTLVFPSFSKEAKAVKLVIRGIEGVDRSFEWKM